MADATTPELSTGDTGGFVISAYGDDDARKSLEALYGSSFPPLTDSKNQDDWARWAKELWARHGGNVFNRLRIVERNRLFRRGVQWVSSTGVGPWREPPMPRDAVRIVENVIAPALDQRVQIVCDQRPGFRTRPENADPDNLKRADAQQKALEYEYDEQSMQDVIREASYWAGTDGVAFLEVYWDPDAGPWDELPVGDGGPGGAQSVRKQPLGDVRTRVRRIEQVRVSGNATGTKAPQYWVIREILPTAEAIARYGPEVVEEQEQGLTDVTLADTALLKHGLQLPPIDELTRNHPRTERFIVYAEPNEFVPDGLTVVGVGQKTIHVGGLLAGRAPMVRMTDGSTDPAFYNTAVMELWIDAQMRINAIKSRWVEWLRRAAGGNLLAREGAIALDSLTAGLMYVTEVKGMGPLSDAVIPFPMPELSQSVKELLALERKAFEDLSGWNDVSRGQFTQDQSGRAILAQREQLEQVFAPPVNAASSAMVQWAELTLAFMRWGYQMPRAIRVVGDSRPDLAREVVSSDFDGVTEVTIDPETLMPMPRSLRLFLLNDLLQRQLISPQEYRRRMPFAWTQNLGTPDDDQEARARRVCEAIRQSGNPQALPVLWQDNEAIHQDILERELILPDDAAPNIRQAALARWQQLAQQASQKHAPPPPQPGSPEALFQKFMAAINQQIQAYTETTLAKAIEQADLLNIAAPPGPPPGAPVGGPAGLLPPQGTPPLKLHKGHEAAKESPVDQHFQGTNPGIAVPPPMVKTMGGSSDQQRLGTQFDRMALV